MFFPIIQGLPNRHFNAYSTHTHTIWNIIHEKFHAMESNVFVKR